MLFRSNTDTGLRDFLSDVALASDVDIKNDETENDKVTLMTIHASKGLEFKNVFIAGMEEDLFPSAMSKDTINGLEEERRLFYVALTRAEENCILTYAGTRFKNGQNQPCISSRFLKDIDTKFLNIAPGVRLSESSQNIGRSFNENNRFSEARKRDYDDYSPSEKARYNDQNRYNSYNNDNDDYIPQKVERKEVFLGAKKLKKVTQTSPTSTSSNPGNCDNVLREGNTIKHERFGIGRITEISGEGENKKAVVQFENVGIKQLLLKFAKFTIID